MNDWLLLLSASADSAWKVSVRCFFASSNSFLLGLDVHLGLTQARFRRYAQFSFALQAFAQLIGILRA